MSAACCLVWSVLPALLLTMPSLAAADVNDAKKSRLMVSAFICSIYSDVAQKDAGETKRLFELGFNAGQQFLKATRAGTITPEEANGVVPLRVRALVVGPSDDFMLGRVYESCAGSAYNNLVLRDAQGSPLVVDYDLRKSTARDQYDYNNCEHLN